MAYTNSMTSPEIEIAGEAAGSFFADSKNKHADLKAMLDSNKDNLKMEAMKRIINIIAKGKEASDLFPAVVKNVAAKNLEVKKLVYVYLMRYAEEQQDLALLSISTFQRALKDPNQLIRASALRVLSSIRVPIIVPIMMMSIKESMRDMSPYVRKVAAHAISKLYSLDPELKDQLIEVIDHLLADKMTLVLGSAVHAFEEVCPERTDLIHKHYRKLCQLLIDVDEWGQVVVINMLTRYARSQFIDPNDQDEQEEPSSPEKFYSSDEDESSGDEKKGKSKKTDLDKKAKNSYVMDNDLRILLRNTKPLLQSRNSAVVLAVCQLYYYLAPKAEIGIIAKALIRLLRNHREVQAIVLTNIATISAKRRSMFEPFLKSFFIRPSDPTHVKLLKLEIITNLATQTNISMILREFQTYVATQDKEFAAATIDAIGRCACNIKEVTDVCLSGLVHLLANKNETVVAQSVVVIKKLLQSQPSEHEDIIRQMAKLIDTVKISAARASIVWLIGEYCQRVPKVAPDVLRKLALNFAHEDEYVKLQVLNLAVKLYLTNKQQVEKLVDYVFQLARYDQSYDLRDRARFLRNLVLPDPSKKCSRFCQSAQSIFLTQKPAPNVESSFKDRDHFQLGTLSHFLNQRCAGYADLPEFPGHAPDSSERNVEKPPSATPPESEGGSKMDYSPHESPDDPQPSKKLAKERRKKQEKFYSDEESVKDEDDADEEEGGEECHEEGIEDEEEEEETDEESDESKSKDGRESESDSDASSTSGEEAENGAELAEKSNGVVSTDKTQKKNADVEKNAKTMDLLLDFDFDAIQTTTAVLAPSTFTSTLSHKVEVKSATHSTLQTAPAQFTNQSVFSVLLDRISGNGLRVDYLFTRSPNLFSNKMCSTLLRFSNDSDQPIESLKFVIKKLHSGMDVNGLMDIDSILPRQVCMLNIGVDFSDTTQSLQVELLVGPTAKFLLNISAPVGEQLEPVLLSADFFKQLQSRLSGMNETSGKILLKENLQFQDRRTFCQAIYKNCNVALVTDAPDRICFAGQTLSGKAPVLLTLGSLPNGPPEEIKLVVNCEKMVIGSMLFKQLKSILCKV